MRTRTKKRDWRSGFYKWFPVEHERSIDMNRDPELYMVTLTGSIHTTLAAAIRARDTENEAKGPGLREKIRKAKAAKGGKSDGRGQVSAVLPPYGIEPPYPPPAGITGPQTYYGLLCAE